MDRAIYLPETQEACRARIADLMAEHQSIRTQIATASLKFQQGGDPIDPNWYRRAKDCQRHKQTEIDQLRQYMQAKWQKATFKDALIELCRDHFSPDQWAEMIEDAKVTSGGFF